jgi:uncharacterized protein
VTIPYSDTDRELEDIFVLDAVAHAYNWTEPNWHDRATAEATAEMGWAVASTEVPTGYEVPREIYLQDWAPEDVANVLFRESATDVAIMHPLPIYAFKDGHVAVEKAVEALERWPTRFIGSYACCDPLMGKKALEQIEYQAELLKPLGLKMYPVSWKADTPQSWKMDEPEVAFPIFEKAAELGIRHIAVHKAVPLGQVPSADYYGTKDIEGAAEAFPELMFEIVHGGLAFVEETAWLLARYPNVYVNMELLNIIVERRPRAFAEIMLGLMRIGGPTMMKRFCWGTGTVVAHPRPGMQALLDFEFPEDLLEGAGMFGSIPQITIEDKRDMFGRNYAELHGIDIDAVRSRTQGDEFSRDPGAAPADPWTTIAAADVVLDHRQAVHA